MITRARYLFIASMDVAPAKEALFNEMYDTEHVPLLLKVPGVLSVTRTKTEPFTMTIGGETKTIVAEGEPGYSAIYELESGEVLTSAAWAKAVDSGRWPGEVRPHATAATSCGGSFRSAQFAPKLVRPLREPGAERVVLVHEVDVRAD
jgi:hypothetical protein